MINSLLLITSAQFIDAEMQNEFGPLPPAFLPVGNRLLIEKQIHCISNLPARRILTLPSDYILPSAYNEKLDALRIDVLFVPSTLSLGNSILYALDSIETKIDHVYVLYGDTIITEVILTPDDVFSLHVPTTNFSWSYQDSQSENFEISAIEDGNKKEVVSGFFSFKHPAALKKMIAESEGDFISALTCYHHEYKLEIVRAGRWHDFGHLHSYFISRRLFSTERSFNKLLFIDSSVKKSSSQKFKISAEFEWYEKIPRDLRIFTPQLLSNFEQTDDEASYYLEYLNLCTLSELYVFGKLPIESWSKILLSCADFLKRCSNHKTNIEHIDIMDLYLPKAIRRLNVFGKDRRIDIYKKWTFNGRVCQSLMSIAHRAAGELKQAPSSLCVVHGDFCFSNIFFDFRSGAIKVIDPRGSVSAERSTIYGDGRYDLAKLYHSVFGYYDLILADFFSLKWHNESELTFKIQTTINQERVGKVMLEALFKNNIEDIRSAHAGCILLFLSMLPLHSDHPERQDALMANALRLSAELWPS